MLVSRSIVKLDHLLVRTVDLLLQRFNFLVEDNHTVDKLFLLLGKIIFLGLEDLVARYHGNAEHLGVLLQ